jgi:hypothetical protein
MSKRLKSEDRQAIDLLLDEPSMHNGKSYFLPSSPVPKRVASVEKLLSLLQKLPAQDPPADLAKRTMQRVEKSQPIVPENMPQDIDRPTL